MVEGYTQPAFLTQDSLQAGVFRNTWRSSSLVEGLNSVLRMHQTRHRRLTQGLLDLKRLYWNCRTFRKNGCGNIPAE